MIDFSNVTISGTLNSAATLRDDGSAIFHIVYSGGIKPIKYAIVTNLKFLIEKSIKPFMIAENNGKRMVITGSLIDANIIAPNRIIFVDSFVSSEQAAKTKKDTIDFSDD